MGGIQSHKPIVQVQPANPNHDEPPAEASAGSHLCHRAAADGASTHSTWLNRGDAGDVNTAPLGAPRAPQQV